MISRASLGRRAQRALRRTHCQCQAQPSNCRGLAAAASGSFTYETGEAAGVKFASRDLPGPTTHVAVVAKAGTRYQPAPGFTDGLENFAFKNTNKRSALRITREAELLGSELNAYHSRENLIVGAKFLRDDLPYFVELLAEVISNTKYLRHQLQEEVLPRIKLSQKSILGNTAELADSSAHAVAFHRGLGTPLHPTSSSPFTKYIDEGGLQAFSQVAYAKDNFAVVANGASHSELSKWVGEFFTDSPDTAPSDLPKPGTGQTKYYGGEERIAHDSGNNIILAFPGSGSFTGGFFKPEISVLSALLGGQTTIKWSPGFSLLSKATEDYPRIQIKTTHHTYSDAGLLCITMSGDASQMRKAASGVVSTLKGVAAGEVSKEDIKKAVAAAKFQTLESGQAISTGIELTGAGLVTGGKAFQLDEVGKSIEKVTEDQVKKAAKSLLDGKATVSTVGDLHLLPFAEEIGLQV
ncbi:MAG: ubiquinol-cytochrome c reductase core subunit 1 [Heterodermia speciosa]|uniref:Cytochrome b-c1 complex subunit 2, mitochondrial n=1 Tax=Heterodermia speciosa TaxID=116794 RepID=A0A8H3FN22_9LECA|nr:MAG: ubiquinol-cytochrome c reductase core subunit 1 [Heterodermia speciosa]